MCCGDASFDFESAKQYSTVLRETQRAMLVGRGYNMDFSLKSDLIELSHDVGTSFVYGESACKEEDEGAEEEPTTKRVVRADAPQSAIDAAVDASIKATKAVAVAKPVYVAKKVLRRHIPHDIHGTRVDAFLPEEEIQVVEESLDPKWKPKLPLAPGGQDLAYPAFAARMALYIESRHGQMPYTEASALVAERAYTAACRDANVRHTTMHVHRRLVLDAYFEVDKIHKWYESRGRAPWFARYARRDRRTTSVVA